MEIAGQRHIAAPLSKVRACLADAGVLQACLPGWIVRRMGGDAVDLSPRDNPTYRCAITRIDMRDPHRFGLRYRVEGAGGGGADGQAELTLAEESDFTLLRYRWADAVAGAELAIERFLGRFAAEVASPREIMADGGVGMVAALAESGRPQAHPSALTAALMSIPTEIFGLPIVFWMGGGVFFVIFLLIASAYV